MKIKMIYDTDWLPNLKEQSDTHVITWTPYTPRAISGYASMSFTHALFCCNLHQDVNFIDNLLSQVDSMDETGTFFPEAPITIMPGWRHPKRQHFLDALKAQDDYINAPKIVIDARFNSDHIQDIVEYFPLIEHRTGESWYLLVNDSKYAPKKDPIEQYPDIFE